MLQCGVFGEGPMASQIASGGYAPLWGHPLLAAPAVVSARGCGGVVTHFLQLFSN